MLRRFGLLALALIGTWGAAVAQVVDLAVIDVVVRPAGPPPAATTTVLARVARIDAGGPPIAANVRFAIEGRIIGERRITLAAGARQTVTLPVRAWDGQQAITATIAPASPAARDGVPGNNSHSTRAALDSSSRSPRTSEAAIPPAEPARSDPTRTVDTGRLTIRTATPARDEPHVVDTGALVMRMPAPDGGAARVVETGALVMRMPAPARDDARVVDTGALVMRVSGTTRDRAPIVTGTNPLILRGVAPTDRSIPASGSFVIPRP